MPESLAVLHETATVKRHSIPGYALLVSLRPHQWVKNTLLFGGLVFSHSLTRIDAVRDSLLGFVAFCLASSGIYLFNDLRDIEEDRKHVVKRFRPLASGAVSPVSAAVILVLLWIESLLLGFRLGLGFGVILAVYLTTNLGYSLGLKKAVILDVMIVASGFVLRAVAGALAIGVKPSPWLILCTLMLALLVGFGKRRHELVLLKEHASKHRVSLQGYSLPFLDLMMAISAAAAVVTYSLYTMADETVARFGTRALVLTTLCVMYGIFRYLYLVHQRGEGGDPARLFITDWPTLVNGVLWIGLACFIIYIYGPASWQLW